MNPVLKIAFWCAVLLFCIVMILCFATYELPSSPTPPSPPSIPAPESPADDDSARRAQFFDTAVQAAIATTDQLNRQAADRCVQRLQETFDGYRKGIQPFSDDLTSWGTRWGVLRRMPSDWWYEKTDIQAFVTEKFEAHLFSAKSLEEAMNSSIKQFKDDVEANNNTLLTEVKAAITRSQLSGIPNIEYGDFAADVTKSLQEFSAGAATESLKNFIVTELMSGMAGKAAVSIIAAVGSYITTTATTTTAAAGGATASGAAAGGGGGALGGPATAAAGVVVGLGVGLIIDWWLSSRMVEQLRIQLNEFIDKIASSVIDGTEQSAGLKQSLAETCDALRDAYQKSLYDRIVKEPTP